MPNRLANSVSPYLLQHAHNPVDWYPWGDEAIARARTEDRPLFVSIGYATCYWCHVMERESFEDRATAEVLNRLFVPVKVDREVRPDIDDIYMTACQAFTRLTEGRASGGWPLSVFVEPQSLKPFYVGTYYPPRPSFGRPSFTNVLTSLADAWANRRAEVIDQAARLAKVVSEELSPETVATAALDGAVIDRAVEVLLRFADRARGGFGGAPKFPQPAYIELLERRATSAPVAEHIARTLDEMAIGGIHDQVGGGFHRYAVDATWTVPHFEKMLYDNAQLAPLYARSFRRTGDAFHAEIARRTCEWAMREMRDGQGAFRSAIDAEVDAREGKNYLWTRQAVEAALVQAGHADLVPFAVRLFGLDGEPNFRDPHHPDEPAAFVLRLRARPDLLASEAGEDPVAFGRARGEVHRALAAARAARRQPSSDDKVLTSWNGLMVAALAECGELLAEPAFVDAAEAALGAVERTARMPDGGVHRATRAGTATTPGFLEDYAALVRAHAALARAGRDADAHLARGAELFAEAQRRFGDPRGAWFDAESGSGELFVRARGTSDGALPCGNSLMVHAGLDLVVGGASGLAPRLRDAFRSLSVPIATQTVGIASGAAALDRALAGAPEVASGLDAEAADPDGITVAIEPDPLPVAGLGARGTLVLTLPSGWHVPADGEGALALSAVASEVVRLTYDVEGAVPWRDGSRVAFGAVRVPFRIEGIAGDSLTLEVAFQPCADEVCHAPRRRRAAVSIRRP